MQTIWIGLLASATMVAGTACSKGGDPPSASLESPGANPRASDAGASASPSAAAPALPAKVGWTGHYESEPGTISVPDGGEWAGVKFRGDDAGVGLGDGALSVTVDSSGRVSGALEGPLGPLRVTGELAENAFGAALVSSDPAHGFAGTAVGTRGGDRITGTMHLSLPTGNVVRQASFSLEMKH